MMEEGKMSCPKRAVILAAGYGLRIVPINTETPKAFLEVHGEYLIERLIKQLHAVFIDEIYIVVGFMADRFQFLQKKYGVHLIQNSFYASKNNLYSLSLVREFLENAYILPSDLWFGKNPFQTQEIGSWYGVTAVEISNDKQELLAFDRDFIWNKMLGVAYIDQGSFEQFSYALRNIAPDCHYQDSFWEEVFYWGEISIPVRNLEKTTVFEITTYEDLRLLDKESMSLHSKAIEFIEQSLNVTKNDIHQMKALKKGMTNRSFLFVCQGKKYIMRIPGEGTDWLINRCEEKEVYKAIFSHQVSDKVIAIDDKTGYKITQFLENSRVCDPTNINDLEVCMKKLREFHQLHLKVGHTFDLYGQLLFYEKLRDGRMSEYTDYEQTKQAIFDLQDFIDQNSSTKVLSHIDAVPDNFLIVDGKTVKEVYLIDWEYAGMQDPHVDIAMFSVYANYSKEEIDTLIDIYFEDHCPAKTRIKIYAYTALCGLLWSNWCEYKKQLGVDFGEYAANQYQYAKDYSVLAKSEIERFCR